MNVVIAIVYSTLHGNTRVTAEAIAAGAATAPGVSVRLIELSPKQIGPEGRWDDDEVMQVLGGAHAIVFGSPTLMGGVSGLTKLFLEKCFDPWFIQSWKDKVAAGFTNSASRSGDKLSTLSYLSIFAAQMGMIWVGVGDPPGGNRPESTPMDVNHLGSWLGLMTQSTTGGIGPGKGDQHTAERFGRRIARSTQRWMAAADQFPTMRLSETEAARRDAAGLEQWRSLDD